MRALPKNVTPSMVIACVALAVALSGPSVAATVRQAISGSQIANNTLPGNRVKRGTLPGDRVAANSLTGRQINESSLAQVPSAATADVATSAAAAGNATQLGSKPASAYRTFATQSIPSGTTVTGAFGFSQNFTGATSADVVQVVSLPGVASSDLSDATVNFASAAGAGDTDATCTGTSAAPTAPAGKVCLYLTARIGLGTTVTGEEIPNLTGSRAGFAVHASQSAGATGVFGTWAYTAQ